MKLYNTLTRTKEEFKPITEGEVKMYSCGPTVYNYFHLGNARPFIVFDCLRQFLEYRGYDVKFVQNFTDVDDKLINKAREEGTTVPEIAEKYIKEYFVDAKALGIKEATVHPRATENIDAIIETVSTLIEKGHAYEVVCDVAEIHLEADKVGHKDNQHPAQQLILQGLEAEKAEKLVPEALFIAVGCDAGRIFEKQQRKHAHQHHAAAQQEEEGSVVHRINDAAKQQRADDGGKYGQHRNGSAQHAAVVLVGDVAGPGVKARVIGERAEKGHNAVGGHSEHRCQRKGAAGIFRKAKQHYRNAPYHVARRHKRFAAAHTVAQCAEKYHGKGARDGRKRHHARNDIGVGGDFGVNIGGKPLVFHMPAKLTRKARYENNDPVFQPDGVFFCLFHESIGSFQQKLCRRLQQE